jgi:RHS repeat-associated protein
VTTPSKLPPNKLLLYASFLTSENGAQVGNTVKYLPFGSCRNSPDLPTDKLFTGQRLDATGLYYYNARYYDATIGRFISADTVIPNPSNPQSFNRYSYCRNNPLKYVDPTGNLDSDYMVLIQYLEQQAAVNSVITQLPPGYASGFGFITGTTPYSTPQSMPGNIASIVANATGGGIAKSKPANGTNGIGVSVSAALGIGISIELFVVRDEQGNAAVEFSISFGGGTPSAGASVAGQHSNALTVDNLSGWGVEAGASGGPISGDYIGGQGKSYSGYEVQLGPSLSPGEVHGYITFTWISPLPFSDYDFPGHNNYRVQAWCGPGVMWQW